MTKGFLIMSNTEDVILEAAELAVKQFKTLDFSEESLVELEDILKAGSEMFSQMPEDMQREKVEVLGCYILEVGRRLFDGDFAWHDGHNQPLLVVSTDKSRFALMPWKKVQGRLSGDVGDNIPYFFRGFAEAVRENAPDKDILWI